MAMNTTIAATFIEENQNSNSPKERADIRFTAVITASRNKASAQAGRAIHWCSMPPPAIASIGTTITQKYQYSQPLVKPAQLPKASLANSVKAPTPGFAAASSLSMRITQSITRPARP